MASHNPGKKYAAYDKLKIQLAEKTHELKIESCLSKVRSTALRMKEPADMLRICKAVPLQLQKLGVPESAMCKQLFFMTTRTPV
ncbi:MAG TPA: hypothetical protein VG847_05135 [Chitinophagaceae bacterium]|nr:hypothetical protein [Chitinophagaceae bacterium]